MRRRPNGDGCISQRKDGFWVAQFTIGIDPKTCKQIRKSIVRKSRQECMNELNKLIAARASGSTIVKPDRNTTLTKWLSAWLNKYKKISIKPTTYAKYESMIKYYIEPELGAYKLQKLNHSIIQAFINKMSNKGFSGGSIRTCINVLSNALNHAIKFQLISQNPCDLVEKPPIVKTEMKFFSLEQLLKFKEVCVGYRLEAAMHLLIHGLRRGEILGLQIENINFGKGTISIQNNLVVGESGKLVLQNTPKTKASVREIPITQEALNLLKTYIGNRTEGFVFITSHGNCIHPRSFERSFDMLLKKAGLPKIRLHDMRHTCVSLMLTNGCDVKTASQYVGHASTAITTEIYAHSSISNQQEAVNILGNLLK